MERFLFGLAVGIWLCGLIVLVLNRCRFSWHQWGVWAFDTAGKSQFRICQRCNFYQACMFRDSRSGEQLFQSRVEQPSTKTVSVSERLGS